MSKSREVQSDDEFSRKFIVTSVDAPEPSDAATHRLVPKPGLKHPASDLNIIVVHVDVKEREDGDWDVIVDYGFAEQGGPK